jgi:regulator of sigma E protease
MIVILQTILAFVILIGVLVFVHEMGHFLAARWNGIRADVFAVGMGPRLFGWNPVTGFTFGKLPEDLDLNGKTDYRLSAFPIGGYVKIAGMIDESMDTDFANRPPERWEFRSKNTLQKAFVISAGVIMNIILAIVVLAGLNFFEGKDIYDTTTIGPVPAHGPAAVAGLQEGDRVVTVNGQKVTNFQDLQSKIYIGEAGNDLKLDVVRAGTPMKVDIPRTAIPNNPSEIEKQGPIIPYPEKMTVFVKNVVKDNPAARAGILPNDTVVSVDGTRVNSVEEFKHYVADHSDKTLSVAIRRGSSIITKDVKPGENGLIGVEIENYYAGPVKKVRYGLFEALGSGVTETIATLGGIYNGIASLFAGKAKLKDSIGGPVMIAKIAQQQAAAGPSQFLKLLAYLSVMLAFMNILPIPALDGGHLVFILIEGVIRREVPLKLRVAVQQVGFAILLLFMAFVIYNDASKLIGN